MKALLTLLTITLSITTVANAGGYKSRMIKLAANSSKAIEAEELISSFDFGILRTRAAIQTANKSEKTFRFLRGKLADNSIYDVQITSSGLNGAGSKEIKTYLEVFTSNKDSKVVSDMFLTLKPHNTPGMPFHTNEGVKIKIQIDTRNMSEMRERLLNFARKVKEDSFAKSSTVTLSRKSNVVPFRARGSN